MTLKKVGVGKEWWLDMALTGHVDGGGGTDVGDKEQLSDVARTDCVSDARKQMQHSSGIQCRTRQ